MIETIESMSVTNRGGWSVKTDMNKKGYLCLADLSSFSVGSKIEFDKVEKTSSKGATYFMMNNPKKPMEQKSAQYVPSSPIGSGYSSVDKGYEMFVCGIVGRAMGSGKFTATDIKGLALASLEAYMDIIERRKQLNPTNFT